MRCGMLGRNVGGLFLGVALLMSVSAWGQEAKNAPPPAAPPPQAGGVAPAANEEKPEQLSFLAYVYRASPFFFFMMGTLSIGFGALVVDHFMKLRFPLIIPPKLEEGLRQLLDEKKYKEAYELVKDDPSLFGRAVKAGVERLSHGWDRGVDALYAVAEEGKMEMEHRASYIAIVGQLSPMLGLLGTVLGMVLSFQQIAQGGQPKPAELANSIGLALVSTLEGLILAIPAIVFFGFFRNRIAKLIFDLETIAESFLWRFAGALKK